MLLGRLAALLLTIAIPATVAQTTPTEDLPYRVPKDPNAKAAYFVDDGYVFALNAVIDGDVYFHMNAPAEHSWMGIGFGSQMAGSFMLVSYPAANGHNLTTSPRLASGHSEPELVDGIVIENIYNDQYAPFANTISPNGVMIAHAVCRNCSTWAGGALDTASKAQPFIFALGPKQDIRSDSLDADLRLHVYHGSFTLDMTLATNSSGDYGRVPAPQTSPVGKDPDIGFSNFGSSSLFDDGTDQNWAPSVHAAMMCVAFVLVFPVGGILMRLTKRIAWHITAQALGMAMVIVGVGVAIYLSGLYNKSKHYNSAHQAIGLLVFAVLFIQLGLGFSQHLYYKRNKQPSILGRIHRYLGPSLILLGLINGGLGFDFANQSHYNVPYGIIAGIMAAIYIAIVSFWSVRRRRQYKPETQTIDMTGYGSQPPIPAEYELNNSTYSPTSPRSTFSKAKWENNSTYSPNSLHSTFSKAKWEALTPTRGYGDLADEELWADTPATMNSAYSKRWENVPLR